MYIYREGSQISIVLLHESNLMTDSEVNSRAESAMLLMGVKNHLFRCVKTKE